MKHLGEKEANEIKRGKEEKEEGEGIGTLSLRGLVRLYIDAFGADELVSHHATIAAPVADSDDGSAVEGWHERRLAEAKEAAASQKASEGEATTHLVSPNAGRLVIFSSGRENLHQVQKVESGTRTVLSMRIPTAPALEHHRHHIRDKPPPQQRQRQGPQQQRRWQPEPHPSPRRRALA